MMITAIEGHGTLAMTMGETLKLLQIHNTDGSPPFSITFAPDPDPTFHFSSAPKK